jgi:hypothetical protein
MSTSFVNINIFDAPISPLLGDKFYWTLKKLLNGHTCIKF